MLWRPHERKLLGNRLWLPEEEFAKSQHSSNKACAALTGGGLGSRHRVREKATGGSHHRVAGWPTARGSSPALQVTLGSTRKRAGTLLLQPLLAPQALMVILP